MRLNIAVRPLPRRMELLIGDGRQPVEIRFDRREFYCTDLPDPGCTYRVPRNSRRPMLRQLGGEFRAVTPREDTDLAFLIGSCRVGMNIDDFAP